jgi:hypothetical protein
LAAFVVLIIEELERAQGGKMIGIVSAVHLIAWAVLSDGTRS